MFKGEPPFCAEQQRVAFMRTCFVVLLIFNSRLRKIVFNKFFKNAVQKNLSLTFSTKLMSSTNRNLFWSSASFHLTLWNCLTPVGFNKMYATRVWCLYIICFNPNMTNRVDCALKSHRLLGRWLFIWIVTKGPDTRAVSVPWVGRTVRTSWGLTRPSYT